MVSYNKDGLGYEPNNNTKSFINIYNAQPTYKCKILKCNYYNKYDHIVMFSFIKNSHKSKEGHPSSYFYKDNCKHKNRKMSTTNIKRPKIIWVSKVENPNCDLDDDTSSFSSNDTTEETNMFHCATTTREEIYSPNNNKAKY